MTQIGMALLGVGRWGTHLLRNFLAHPQIRLVAVVDSSAERLSAIAAQFSLDSQVQLLTDPLAALALPGLEAAAIATPAMTHDVLIQAALNHSLHVLAEKPLTLDPQSARALWELAQQQRRQLVVDHTYLFHPAVQAGKDAIAQLGPLRYGYASRTHLGPIRNDVDALWDLAIHDIAIFNHWLGETPLQVQAQGLGWLQPQRQTMLSPSGLADAVWCRLRYSSGFQATIHLCWANPDKQRRLCVVGDRGTLIFDELQPSPLTLQVGIAAKTGQGFSPEAIQTVTLPVTPSEPLRNVCDHFVDCIWTQQDSAISSGQQGQSLVAILTKLTESMHRDGAWLSL
ncbi:Gfo/Idh/MocA family oxidoreductase [Romeria aff. gracilis LEGE 07310]|uniref:Gfo/Idh/MocA family oxidoreductase n=1 Tax=Vasconcelosia minhoensis LEGE 07310 TaxID=915328 RepID=A0A8J7AQL9_9CYAN|nr:Gfo/Idh/MocA family oxidoreductase [Romeria gracilis]MBE9078646.1 Gfo/Idh/MocA family oxidoreductase [Romeria aff. gracilis LEGE 07310]